MATIVLAPLGPVGLFVGGMIDSLFLFPTIFKPDSVEAARLNDLQLTGTSEGAPLYRIYGTTRIPGTIVWQTPLKEVLDTESGGGKGGAGGEFVTFKYYSSLAIMVAPHQINKVKRIWADGKIFYDEAPDVIITSNAIEATIQDSVIPLGQGGFFNRRTLTLRNTDGTVDLTKFAAGGGMILSGFTGIYLANNSDNSGTGEWYINSSKKSGFTPNTTEVVISSGGWGTFYPFVAMTAGVNTLTMVQELPLFKTADVADIRFYDGSSGQQTDELMDKWVLDSASVVNNIPYRDRAYIVCEDLLLTNWGNRIPNFEIEVEAEDDPPLRDAYSRMFRTAGYGTSEFDVSKVTPTLHGYAVRGSQPTSTILGPLAIAYDTMSRRKDEVLEMYDRTAAPTLTITNADLSAHEQGGSDADYPFRVKDDSELFMPRQITVEYPDAGNDYQNGMRKAFNPSATNDNTEKVSLPIVLTPGEAQALASKLMFARFAARQEVTFTLPHTYLDKITEGMVVTIANEMGDTWTIMTHRVEVGANWLIEVAGRVEDPDVFTQTQFADESGIPKSLSGDETGGTQDPGGIHIQQTPLAFYVLDIANLSDRHGRRLGVYIAPFSLEPRHGWRACALYESMDQETYTQKQVFRDEAIVGRVTTPASVVVSPGYWDTTNTIRVELHRYATRVRNAPTLESRIDDEVLDGANRIAIHTANGWEIVGFANAVLVTTDPVPTYDLSRLIRGLRATEDAMGGHAAGNVWVLLTGPGISFVDMNTAAIDRSRYWKLVPSGGDLAIVSEVEWKIAGNSIKPFPATAIDAFRNNATNFVNIRWMRQSRAIGRLFVENKPDLEDTEQWDIVFAKQSDTTKGRTVRAERPLDGWVRGQPEVTYTAAQQTADGITPGDTLTYSIYQISTSLGRGRVASGTI